MKIYALTEQSKYWNATMDFAEKCSWKAGKFLARLMKESKFKNWERVFVAIVDEKPIAYCTLAEKDELPEQYSFSPFIGFVFVDEKYRGNRISELLINESFVYAITLEFQTVYIMSGEKGLYEKYGFTKIGNFETVYGTVDGLFIKVVE